MFIVGSVLFKIWSITLDRSNFFWHPVSSLWLRCIWNNKSTLWQFNIAIENHHFNGKISYKWQFSTVMLVYQRVSGNGVKVLANIFYLGDIHSYYRRISAIACLRRLMRHLEIWSNALWYHGSNMIKWSNRCWIGDWIWGRFRYYITNGEYKCIPKAFFGIFFTYGTFNSMTMEYKYRWRRLPT